MNRTVLVTDARRGSAIAFIRSLGARGWHVIAADSDARSAGFRSRFAAERWVYPAPADSPRAFVEQLLGLAGRRSIDLIVPVTDECIHPLAHARARFPARTQLAIAPQPALEIVTDKQRTLELAAGLGIPVPATRAVATLDEARAAAAELGFPLVVKPTVSRRFLPEQDRILAGAVSFARDLAELERRVIALLGRHAVLVQEYRHGVGVGVECLARAGAVLHAFQHERLAEIPVTGGASAWRRSVPLDEELLAHARALIAALSWTGLIMVEFKRGERPWLLEVNGRVWGSLPLACLAGVDFPGELAELYFPRDGRAPCPPRPYRVGLRAYNLELMLSWIAQVLLRGVGDDALPRPRRSRALHGLAGLLDPHQKSDLAGARDPAPRLAEAGHIARKLARKLAGAARGSER